MRSVTKRTWASIAAAPILTGCTHSLVYNEARDKQAQEAKRAASELKIGDTVKQLEKSYAEVAKLELDSARSLAETLRNKELGRIVRAGSLREAPRADMKLRRPSGLVDVLEHRMTELGAKPRTSAPDAIRNCGTLDCASLETIERTPVTLAEKRESFELSRAIFRSSTGHDFQNCAQVVAVAEEPEKKEQMKMKAGLATTLATAARTTSAVVNVLYENLTSPCVAIHAALDEAKASLDKVEKDNIPAVLLKADRVEKEVAVERAQLIDAQSRLRAAVEDFKNLEKSLTARTKNQLDDFYKRIEDLKATVGKVKEGANALGAAGAHAWAKEVATQLETALNVVTGDKSTLEMLNPEDRAAVAFVRSAPELAAEADKLFKEAGKPRLVPLAFARDHYRLVAKGHEDQIAIKTRRAEALRARADALMKELAALAQAHRLLTNGRRAWEAHSLTQLESTSEKVHASRCGKFENAEEKKDCIAKERFSLYEALAIYWDEVFLYRSEEQVLKAQAQALEFEEPLARSASAALQWDNLIIGVGNMLGDYHATGIKLPDAAEFLKAIGLFYIGARVGR